MAEKPSKIVYRSLHAPKENGGALIEPSIGEFAKQVETFFRTSPDGTRLCWGAISPLAHRMEARIELGKHFVELPDLTKPPILDERNPPLVHADVMNQPLVMVGHQPQLFHPGVWMKNMVAARLAQQVGGKALNLVVDNDVMKLVSIAVPARTGEGAIAQVAFDALTEEMPYEERKVMDEGLADTFAARVETTMPEREWTPLLQKTWETTPRLSLKVVLNRPEPALDETAPADLRTQLKLLRYFQSQSDFRSQLRNLDFYWRDEFSKLRSDWESAQGYKLYNLSLSKAISTRAFGRLALEIMHDAQAFAEIYNASLAEYRRVHRLRSRSHPAPDLEIASSDEVELPFWIWTSDALRRKRTFIKRAGSKFTITDREGLEWAADFEKGEELVDKLLTGLLGWTNVPSRPKLRPKALITTLYARLLLCDGFVHGIGGAKYDQVTEAIAARWGLGTLAPMQCATMTLRLPLPMDVISVEEVRKRKRKLRELIYHPEKFLGEENLTPDKQARVKELCAQKIEWLGRSLPEELRARHQAIAAINAELATMLSTVRERAETAFKEGQERFNSQQPWLSREFAAVLFPEEMLKREFARVVGQ